ncbi:MAG TPA: WG repeat-containing protein [Oscillospiraceae bacterium]|nr:WG repeat-containing protein [Oscillospiraceae bacterium]HPF56021.1 WG repeat-containing protein [Clostridiales bacterium]HPK35511.1 WG repeat-containing protein [Oscillospiraceae bacterium]HPR76049.1 WG repeat-containing protein [Oscillospiraceae bacterium]
MDTTGKEIVPLKYDSVSYFQDGMAAVSNGGEYYHFFDEEMGEMSGYDGSKWGFIDTAGKEVVPCQYNIYSNFTDGVAIINTGTNGNQGNHYGVIDKTGKMIVPVGKYTWFGDISDGMIAACSGSEYPSNKWGFIDVSGKEVIPCIYSFTIEGIIPSFSEGLAWCGCGLMDKDGKFLIDATRYDKIWFFHEGMVWVQLNNKYGFIDNKGNEVVIPKYGYVRDFKEGFAAVCLNKSQHSEWGYIDKTGKEITPFIYSGAESFNEGYAAVSVGNNDNVKWGFINQAGTLVVECQYEDVNRYQEGMAAVCLNDKWGFISFSN